MRVRPMPETQAAGRAILEALRWQGVADAAPWRASCPATGAPFTTTSSGATRCPSSAIGWISSSGVFPTGDLRMRDPGRGTELAGILDVHSTYSDGDFTLPELTRTLLLVPGLEGAKRLADRFGVKVPVALKNQLRRGQPGDTRCHAIHRRLAR